MYAYDIFVCMYIYTFELYVHVHVLYTESYHQPGRHQQVQEPKMINFCVSIVHTTEGLICVARTVCMYVGMCTCMHVCVHINVNMYRYKRCVYVLVLHIVWQVSIYRTIVSRSHRAIEVVDIR